MIVEALKEGQRVKTTAHCSNLYLKPGQVGKYLQPFKQDPENTGLFEWQAWIHPLSCRSTYAVPFRDVELDEEPNTDDEDGVRRRTKSSHQFIFRYTSLRVRVALAGVFRMLVGATKKWSSKK